MVKNVHYSNFWLSYVTFNLNQTSQSVRYLDESGIRVSDLQMVTVSCSPVSNAWWKFVRRKIVLLRISFRPWTRPWRRSGRPSPAQTRRPRSSQPLHLQPPEDDKQVLVSVIEQSCPGVYPNLMYSGGMRIQWGSNI